MQLRVTSPFGVTFAACACATGQPCPAGEVFEHPGVRSLPGIVTFRAADVNRDGATDLVVLNRDSIAVHLNDGTGTLGDPLRSTLTGSFDDYLDAHLADLDGDGDDDLVVNQPGWGTLLPLVEIYRNDGSGVYARSGEVPIGTGVDTLQVRDAQGDFNGDGLPDLLVTQDSTTHRVLLNTGGGFGAQAWDLPPLPEGLALEAERFDQNNDGIADVFLSLGGYEPSKTVYTVLSSPAGLGPLIASPADISAASVHRTHFFDIDRDGYTDFFFASASNNASFAGGASFGRADGGFDAPVYIPNIDGSELRRVLLQDPTAPAETPAWFVPSRIDTVGVRLIQRVTFDATRTPTTELLLDAGGEPLRGSLVSSGDFDGNGLGDLLLNRSPDVAAVYRRTAHGSFETDPEPLLFKVFPRALADFNADGVEDVIINPARTPSGDALLRVALSDGVSGFDLEHAPTADRILSDGVIFADLNGDGVTDLIAPGISVSLGSADGTFGPVTELTPAIGQGNAGVGDLNADGHPDVFMARGQNELTAFYGDGTGAFGPEQVLAMPNTHVPFDDNPRVAGGDIDGDGWDDIVIALAGGSDRGWVFWHHQGTGSYGSFTQFDAPRPSDPRIADLDGDGKAEILLGTVSPVASAAARVLWNRGDRSFDAELLAERHARLVPVGDLDGDGIGDIVGLNGLTIYESGGSPSFGPGATLVEVPGIEPRLGDYAGARGIDPADLDQDGDLDLLLAGEGVGVIRNRGDGVYGRAGWYDEGYDDEAGAVLTRDLNQDGMPDAVLVYPRTTSVRVNQCSPPAPCPADLAPPAGVLDLADIAAFVGGFISGDPIADLNPDGVFDLADITAFIASFNAGCP